MISTPAWAMRMRSRFDSTRGSNVDISRPNMLTGISDTNTTNAAVAYAIQRGRGMTITVAIANSHASHALRVNVSSSAKLDNAAGTAIHHFRSCSQRIANKSENGSRSPEYVITCVDCPVMR